MSSGKQAGIGIGIALVVLCVVAGAPARADDAKAFADLTKQWETSYNAGDAAAVAALYTEDGTMLPPNAAAASGRKAIEAAVKNDMAANPGKLEIRNVEHGVSGTIAFVRGTYKALDADGKTVDTGKWMDVRKKVGGKWLIHSDIWNSDMPLPE